MAEMKNEVWEAVNDYYELRMDKDLAGHEAWYVKYLGRKDHVTCLWVWNAGPEEKPGEEYVLRTGADCD